jgi:hypothetical protein
MLITTIFRKIRLILSGYCPIHETKKHWADVPGYGTRKYCVQCLSEKIFSKDK